MAAGALNVGGYQYKKVGDELIVSTAQDVAFGKISYTVDDGKSSVVGRTSREAMANTPVHVFARDSLAPSGGEYVYIDFVALQSVVEARKRRIDREFEEVSGDFKGNPLLLQEHRQRFCRDAITTHLGSINPDDWEACAEFYDTYIAGRITSSQRNRIFYILEEPDDENISQLIQKMQIALNEFRDRTEVFSHEGRHVVAYLGSKGYDVLDLLLYQAALCRLFDQDVDLTNLHLLHRFPVF